MTILIAFVLVWCVFAIWAMRRKMGATIAWGGGFIVGCLAAIALTMIFVPLMRDDEKVVASEVSEKTEVTPPAKGLGLSYDQLMMSMGPFAPEMKPAPTTQDGRTRLLGTTAGGSNGVLEVSGKSLSRDVEKATLLFIFSSDEQASLANTEMTMRYIAAVFPEWPSQERYDWMLEVFRNFEGSSVSREGKKLESKVSKQTGMFTFTVTPI
jgi:hypothetical protein